MHRRMVESHAHAEIYLINTGKIKIDCGHSVGNTLYRASYHDIHDFGPIRVGHLLQPVGIAQVPLIARLVLQRSKMGVELFVLRGQPGEFGCEARMHHVLVASAESKDFGWFMDKNVKRRQFHAPQSATANIPDGNELERERIVDREPQASGFGWIWRNTHTT